jgi:hypothetical protein
MAYLGLESGKLMILDTSWFLVGAYKNHELAVIPMISTDAEGRFLEDEDRVTEENVAYFLRRHKAEEQASELLLQWSRKRHRSTRLPKQMLHDAKAKVEQLSLHLARA